MEVVAICRVHAWKCLLRSDRFKSTVLFISGTGIELKGSSTSSMVHDFGAGEVSGPGAPASLSLRNSDLFASLVEAPVLAYFGNHLFLCIHTF